MYLKAVFNPDLAGFSWASQMRKITSGCQRLGIKKIAQTLEPANRGTRLTVSISPAGLSDLAQTARLGQRLIEASGLQTLVFQDTSADAIKRALRICLQKSPENGRQDLLDLSRDQIILWSLEDAGLFPEGTKNIIEVEITRPRLFDLVTFRQNFHRDAGFWAGWYYWLISPYRYQTLQQFFNAASEDLAPEKIKEITATLENLAKEFARKYLGNLEVQKLWPLVRFFMETVKKPENYLFIQAASNFLRKNPGTSAKQISEIYAASKNILIICEMARHPNTPRNILLELCSSSSTIAASYAKGQVLASPNLL